MSSAGTTGRHFQAFDLIRIVAALAVILHHSFNLSGRDVPSTDMGQWNVNLGHTAVGVFFVISGFLITMSWVRKPVASSFGVRRFTRIYPAFFVVVVLAAFVLGPVVTSLSLSEYFSGRPLEYTVHNLLLDITYTLPGVFDSNPNKAVNGSLWTIPYEVVAYIGVLALGLIGVLNRRVIVVVLFIGALIAFRLGVAARVLHLPLDGVAGFSVEDGLPLASFFLAGMCLFLFEEALPWTPLAGGLAAVGVAVGFVVGEPILFVVALSYLVIFLGMQRSSLAVAIRRAGDPSYGTYLYGFPVQQLLVMAGVTNVALLTASASVIALALGFVSWHLLEQPCIQLAGRFRRGDRPDPTDLVRPASP